MIRPLQTEFLYSICSSVTLPSVDFRITQIIQFKPSDDFINSDEIDNRSLNLSTEYLLLRSNTWQAGAEL